MNALTVSLLGIFLCLAILTISGKYFVEISTKLARNLGVSDVIIGTTLVALTTGAPTLFVSIIAFTNNQTDIALGNLIGTNYVNLGLALGIPAFMTTILVKQEVFEKEIPLYFAITALFTAFMLDKQITLVEGIILLVFLAASWLIIIQYAFFHNEKKEEFNRVIQVKGNVNKRDIVKQLTWLILLMLLLLVASFGISYLSPILSANTGISSYILGLTLVGIGTSIPTIATNIVAARKGNTDLIVGNVFGGNLLNIGLGISVMAIIKPLTTNTGAISDIFFVNLYGAIIIILILSEMKLFGKKHKTLSQISGLIMIGVYIVYTVLTVIHK